MPHLGPGDYDLYRPRVSLVSFPRSHIRTRGPFKRLIAPLVKAATDEQPTKNTIFVPVHELQLVNVKERFKEARVVPGHVTMDALASVRSLVAPELLPGLSLKLCLGMNITSALRTITPFTTYFGPGFSRNVLPRLTYDRNILEVEQSLASAVYRHPDSDVAKHCSCIVRRAVEYEQSNNYNYSTYVMCAVLGEKIQRPDTRETLLTHVWKLDARQKRVRFLKRYIDVLLRAVLPPCIVNGVAFEAHGQNMLARFDRETGELTGFAMCDFGGIKVHRPTLQRSCGAKLDVLPDSAVVAHSLNDAYKVLYHTLIQMHFQHVIRALDLHYCSAGWAMVRAKLEEIIPNDHPMYKWFLEQETIPDKALIRMKIDGLYRTVLGMLEHLYVG